MKYTNHRTPHLSTTRTVQCHRQGSVQTAAIHTHTKNYSQRALKIDSRQLGTEISFFNLLNHLSVPPLFFCFLLYYFTCPFVSFFLSSFSLLSSFLSSLLPRSSDYLLLSAVLRAQRHTQLFSFSSRQVEEERE